MIPIDEQIEYMQSIVATSMLPTHMPKAILASLERLKRIDEVQVPDEPIKDEYECYDHYVDSLKDYIDTLRDLLKKEIADRVFAESMLKDYRGAFTLQQERAEAAEAKLAAIENDRICNCATR